MVLSTKTCRRAATCNGSVTNQRRSRTDNFARGSRPLGQRSRFLLLRLELPMPRLRLVLVLALVGALLLAPAAHGASSDMVVSQLFAGGGNAGASYTND